MRVDVELCVSDVAGCTIAARAGCARIELCRDLEVGGLTPPDALVADVLAAVRGIDVQILVRSRPGGFTYTRSEIERMADDIARLRELTSGTEDRVGFVVGCLTADGAVDVAHLRRLVSAADGRPVTFHRAFDEVHDQVGHLLTLAEAGVSRVLTTGGDPRLADVRQLRRLVAAAPAGITILASGGLRAGNVAAVAAACGAREVHMRAPDGRGGTDEREVGRIIAALTR